MAFPTGTSYGLAVDALQGWAVQRLRNLKKRPTEKTFTIFMPPTLYDQFLELTPIDRQILTALHKKPLTLLVRAGWELAHLAQDGLVGLRVIDHPLMEKLAQSMTVPLTATSANRAGEPACLSPAEIQHVFLNPLPDHLLGEKNPRGTTGTTYDLSLAAILDGGTLPPTEPTTIARVDQGKVSIIRQGTLTEKDIASVV